MEYFFIITLQLPINSGWNTSTVTGLYDAPHGQTKKEIFDVIKVLAEKQSKMPTANVLFYSIMSNS